MIRTDLAMESDALLKSPPNGVAQKVKTVGDIKIIDIEVLDDNGAASLGRPKGKYITFVTKSMLSFDKMVDEQILVSKALKAILPKQGFVLVVGLGNENVTPDAVGPITASNIIATRHFHKTDTFNDFLSNLRKVSVIHPGVLGQTGIEASEITLSLCRHLEPVAVIAIDALAARSVDRLGQTIQISTAGISPGSGVSNSRKELSYKTLGIPVISIGVPTVVDMQTIAQEYCNDKISNNTQNMMVTPRNIDHLIEKSSKLLSIAINMALFDNLSLKDIESLTAK